MLTLLFVRLVAPQMTPRASFGQHAAATTRLLPAFGSFVLTFAVVCTNWNNQHFLFSHIRQVTTRLVWLNNLLLGICILPFTTELLGHDLAGEFPVVLYAEDSLLVTITFYLLRRHAAGSPLFKAEGRDADALGPRHSLPGLTFFMARRFPWRPSACILRWPVSPWCRSCTFSPRCCTETPPNIRASPCSY